VKIAHISDLHICAKNKPENIKKSETLIRTAYESDVDHLIISGDISHNSNILDFQVLRDLLKKYNFLDSKKCSVVIGNHDIYGGVHLAVDLIHFPQNCKKTDFEAKAKQFGEIFKETFDNAVLPKQDSYFPYVKILNDTILIGFNSNEKYASLSNLAASSGRIELNDINAVTKILSKYKNSNMKKIVILHHHLMDGKKVFENKLWHIIEQQTMKLKKKARFLKFIQDINADLIVHGHVHQNVDYDVNGTLVLNAGGCVENDLDGHLRINFINFEENEIKIDIRRIINQQPEIEVHELLEQLIPSFA